VRRREFAILAGLAALGPSLASPVLALSKPCRIGFLGLVPGEDLSTLLGRLRELGYVPGENLTLIKRSAEGDAKRLPMLADELVREKPDVLVAGWGTLAPKALAAATATVPIVFTAVGDPVGAGLVENLARPGGNVTGFSAQVAELKGKQLSVLKELLPGTQIVGVLMNPDTPYGGLALRQLRAAAERDGTRLEVLEIRSPEEFTAARMDALVARGVTALFVFSDPLSSSIGRRIAEEARRLRLPSISDLREFAVAGAAMSYGPPLGDYRRAAEYIDMIVNGTRAGDLPVEQPTTFELVINLQTARSIGLTIPPTLLARTDEVIE
jgi:putative ABC transport system substrate-binding protein